MSPILHVTSTVSVTSMIRSAASTAGIQTSFTLCGSILVEGIFGWPGIGNYSLQAIQTSDFPVIQGFVLYAAVLYVVLYEGLAIVYGYIDPRTRS